MQTESIADENNNRAESVLESLKREPLSWHISNMLSGKVMIAELASKILLLTGLHNKTRMLGIRNELAVTLMCDAILKVCYSKPLDVTSARTGNNAILEFLKTQYDESLIAYVNTHTKFAPEQLKQWFAAQLEEQRAEIMSRMNLFSIRASEESNRILTDKSRASSAEIIETQRMLFPESSGGRDSKPNPIYGRRIGNTGPKVVSWGDNIHKENDPHVKRCPRCGDLGREHISIKRGHYYDVIYHAKKRDDGSVTSNYHAIREIDAETAALLKEQYEEGAHFVSDEQRKKVSEAVREAARRKHEQELSEHPPIVVGVVSGVEVKCEYMQPLPAESIVIDAFHKIGDTNVIVCPRVNCGQPGRITVNRSANAFYLACEHTFHDSERNEVRTKQHLLRKIDDNAEALEMRKKLKEAKYL